MDTRLREELRKAILRVMEEKTGRYGIPLDAVTLHVRVEGFPDIVRTEVDRELLYLEQQGFIEQALRQISPENRHWRIHAKGRDFLASME